MDEAPHIERQGLFRLKELPAEILCRVYYFAIVQPHPLPLIAGYVNNWVRFYTVEKDLRMINTDSEFREEMKKLLYSENSFSFSVQQIEPEEGAHQFRVELGRIQKCYISVNQMREEEDSDYGEFFTDGLEFQTAVSTLIFEGHEMKYLLIECEPQICGFLAEGLSPLSMLRRLRLVHFRSSQTQMHHYFRFLEGLMMSDQPVPFTDLTDFWESSSSEDDLLRRPEESWLMKSLEMTTAVVENSEEQMEATAKELYSILGIEREFIPQNELDETCPFWNIDKDRFLF